MKINIVPVKDSRNIDGEKLRTFLADVMDRAIVTHISGGEDSLAQRDVKTLIFACQELWNKLEDAKTEIRQISSLGNASNERKALVRLKELSKTVWESDGGEDVSSELAEMQDVINAALSEPPRWCDLFGTAKAEDAERTYEIRCEQSGKEKSVSGAFEWMFSKYGNIGETNG